MLAFALVVGCAHHVVSAPPSAFDARIALATDDVGPWRARVVGIFQYQLVGGRGTMSPGHTEPFDVAVVAADGEQVWVRDEQGGVRVVLAIPRAQDQLAFCPVEPTFVAASPAAVGQQSTVVLAGCPTSVTAGPDERIAEVTLATRALSVDGWVPRSALSEVWRPAPLIHGDEWSDLALPGDGPVRVQVFDAPDGRPIAAIDGRDLVLRRVGSRGAWVQLQALTAAATAEGWVATTAVEAVAPYQTGHGSGAGSGAPPEDAVDVPAGTLLYVPGAADPFGRATVDVRLERVKAGSDDRVRVPTRWGSMEAEIRR